jgi:hypothetical protein
MTEKKKATELSIDKSRLITVVCKEGEDPDLATARMLLGPHVTNANTAALFAKRIYGELLPIASLVTASFRFLRHPI